VGSVVSLAAGSSVTLLVAEAEAIGSEACKTDPSFRAVSLSSSLDPDAIDSSSSAFWKAYWGRSALFLPTRPRVQQLWYGASYAMALTASRDPSTAPPGLYGVFATSDGCLWNGDYTLDYNQESTFFGVYSSNHAELAESYFGPILDWMPAAKTMAQQQCNASKKSCAPNALHFGCHLAPWGLQSFDTSYYVSLHGAA